jgi:hypothetical protein
MPMVYGRYPMPRKLKQIKKQTKSFVLKKNIVLIVGLTAKMVNKIVQKWSYNGPN